MCGRYLISLPPEAMRTLFEFDEQPNFPARYNIAPTQPVPIIRLEGGRRHFVLVRWGLIPSWVKEEPKSLLINARAETIAEKPSFRAAFRHRRALMPADGFYEWKVMPKGPKQPYLIRRRDGRPFAMAALWDNWMTADGSEIESCAVVTTDANATLAPIHERMPVILDEKDWARWLDPLTPLRELQALMKPAPDDLLEAIPVSEGVNRVANDHPGLIVEAHVRPRTVPEAPAPRKRKPTDDRQGDLF